MRDLSRRKEPRDKHHITLWSLKFVKCYIKKNEVTNKQWSFQYSRNYFKGDGTTFKENCLDIES